MEKVTNTQLGRPESYLSASYILNGTVFTSGSVGNAPSGEYPESVEEQTHYAIKNLQETLIASGSTLDTVMKVLLFIADANDAPKINEIYKSYFPHKPARSCVIVQFPNPKVKVELECVAAVKSKL